MSNLPKAESSFNEYRLPLDAPPLDVINFLHLHDIRLGDFTEALKWVRSERPTSEYQNIVRFVNIMRQQQLKREHQTK